MTIHVAILLLIGVIFDAETGTMPDRDKTGTSFVLRKEQSSQTPYFKAFASSIKIKAEAEGFEPPTVSRDGFQDRSLTIRLASGLG